MRSKFVACIKIKTQEHLKLTMETKDSNGNILNDGDSVHVIKDLKVKGMSTTLKRGNVIKGIRLTGSPNEVECRVGKSTVVLKTEFLKKA